MCSIIILYMANIVKLKHFCDKHTICREGVCVYTFQRNSAWASIVVDWTTSTILPNYTDKELSMYSERQINSLTICYRTGLDSPVASVALPSVALTGRFPCCENNEAHSLQDCIFDMNSLELSNDFVFKITRSFLKTRVFIDCRYYQLIDGEKKEVSGNFIRKLDTLKNYTCQKCDLFFQVELFKTKQKSDDEFMRLATHTVNETDTLVQLLEE